MHIQLAFIFFIIATVFATIFAERCNDINAIHELKISSNFKNTIQSYNFLPDNQLYFVTQELQFGDEGKYVSNYFRGHFTEENGGNGQFEELEIQPENIVKGFVALGGKENFVSVSVNSEKKLSYLLNGKRVAFNYPLKAENVYNTEGDVVETRENFDVVTIEEINFEASRRQIQLVDTTSGSKGSFLGLYFNEGSLKLFSATVSDSSVTYTWSKLVLPKVTGFDVIARNYDSILTLSEDRKQIFVVVTIDSSQKAAFEKEHNVQLAFNDMNRAPFLVIFDLNGNLQSVSCLISKQYSESENAYVSGIDVRNNMLTLVGNEVPSAGLYFEDSPRHPFHTLFDLESMKVVQTRALNYLLSGDFGGHGFKVRDIVFAPDGKTDMYFIAGDIIPSDDNLYDIEGAVFLSDGSAVYRELLVGESGANVVRKMARYHSNGHETVVADLYMDGPLSPPEDPKNPNKDQFRKVNAGFWMIDCSSPNAPIEIGARIIFYSVVSFTILLFISAVSSFATTCYRDLREKRRQRRSEEENPLVVNRS